VKRAITWIGILLSVALVALIVTRFDLEDALAAIRTADPWWLALATLAYCTLFPLRGLRWAMLLRPIKPIGVRASTEVFLIGFMANNVLPARLGDVARAVVLARRERVPASATFSNVMLERIFDGLVVVGILELVLAIDPPQAPWVGPVSIGMAALFSGALLFSILVAWREQDVLRFARVMLGVRGGEIVEKVGSGLHTLKSARQTLEVVVLSAAIWTLEVAVYLLLQRAFDMHVSWLGMAFVMSVLTLGLTAPSAPGFVGVFEGLVIVGVTLFGVEIPLATAFALTLHLIHYVPGTLLGLALAWSSGIKLRELESAQRDGREPLLDAR
jgi:glycosyltransferase 2 family protein